MKWEKVLGKHGSSLIIIDNLEDAEIREQILDIWGGFEVEVQMNSLVKDTLFDEELSLGDAIRPYVQDAFRLTLQSIGYKRMYLSFPGFQDLIISRNLMKMDTWIQCGQ